MSKEDGSLRFWVNYQRLNSVTKRGSYPIPRMNERIGSLGKAKMFSASNDSSSYMQIRMNVKDVNEKAFITFHGLFKYTRMPYGLKNAQASFQRAKDVIVASVG